MKKDKIPSVIKNKPFIAFGNAAEIHLIGKFIPLVRNYRFQSGFTLLELFAVITVVGILAAIAVPSINSFIQSNQLTATTNEFLADLKLARSEAIKRGVQSAICESSSGSGCSSTGNWNAGWMLFSDTDSSGAWNQSGGAEDVLIRQHAAVPALHAITTSAGSTTTVIFNRQGGVSTRQQYIVCNSKIGKSRTVTVSTTGQISISEGSC